MKEAIFILLVVLVLAVITAIRYRKQIAGVIGIARMLRDTTRTVARGTKDLSGDAGTSIPLVNCSKCGVWVPKNKAIRSGGLLFCSEDCLKTRSASGEHS
jgi:hypothetical protein